MSKITAKPRAYRCSQNNMTNRIYLNNNEKIDSLNNKIDKKTKSGLYVEYGKMTYASKSDTRTWHF